MHLTPSETDKLLLATAGMVARERRDRGVALNYPEAVALLSCWVIERARDGDATVTDLMRDGRGVLSRGELTRMVHDSGGPGIRGRLTVRPCWDSSGC